MKLIPISEHPDHAKILWDLLAERTPEQNISHKEMPTWEEHLAFVDRMAPIPAPKSFGDDVCFGNLRYGEPRYERWYLIEVDDAIVGAVYLTHGRAEIGISIFKRFQQRGFGADAVRMLMQKYRSVRLLANINPANEPSRKMFEKLGFKKIQETFALDAD